MTESSETRTGSRALASEAGRAGSGLPTGDAHAATMAADDAEAQPHVALLKGSVLGRYVVLGHLGEGGMGVVYSAYDPDLDRKVAVKLLHSTTSRTGPARLLREAQAMARLTHPNVVAVHDVGLHDDRVFVAMEFIEGVTLRQWHAQHKPPWKDVLEVILAAAAGLSAAHEGELIHRDLKPDNIMLSDAGQRVRVMDFGLARLGASEISRELASADEPAPGLAADPSADEPLTADGVVPGTPAYMSAELWQGQPASPASDIFALCVTAWELLYGRRPFLGSTRQALSRAVIAGRVDEPEPTHRTPRWLRRVLLRGLHPEPGQRWQSVPALLAAIAQGRRQSRVRRLGASVVAIAAAGAAVWSVDAWQARRRHQQCIANAAAIAEDWNDEARQATRAAAVAAVPGYGDQAADRFTTALDAWTKDWAQAREATCNDADQDFARQAEVCLTHARQYLRSLVDALRGANRALTVAAVARSGDLPDPAQCREPGHVRQHASREGDATPEILALHAGAARAASLRWSGKYRDAARVLDEVVDKAQGIGRRDLIALFSAQLGRTKSDAGDFEPAAELLYDAYEIAYAEDIPALVVELACKLAELEGQSLQRPLAAAVWLRVAAAALARGPDLGPRDRILYLHVLAEQENSTGNPGAALARMIEANTLREQVLGPGHPDVAVGLSHIGHFRAENGEVEEGIAQLRDGIARYEQAVGAEHPGVAPIYNNLAYSLQAAGRLPEALTAARRARQLNVLHERDDTFGGALAKTTLGYVLMLNGKLDEAATITRSAIETFERDAGKDHPFVGVTLGNLGQILWRQQKHAAALPVLTRAVEIARPRAEPRDVEFATMLLHIGQARIELDDAARARAPLHEVVDRLAEDPAGDAVPILEAAREALASLDAVEGAR